MKKITKFMLIAVIMLGCSSCEKKPDHFDPPITKFLTYYTYVNKSSSTITINAGSQLGMTGEIKKEKFTIYKNKTLDMEYMRKNFLYPFSLFHSGNTVNKLEVSNGKVMVRQWSNKKDKLFDLNQYTLTIEEPHDELSITRYTYTFTDDFFKDGEPIE